MIGRIEQLTTTGDARMLDLEAQLAAARERLFRCQEAYEAQAEQLAAVTARAENAEADNVMLRGRMNANMNGYIESVHDLRIKLDTVTAERDALKALAEVHGKGCQCGDDDACAFVRERDALVAELRRSVSVNATADPAAVVDTVRSDVGVEVAP